MEIQRPYQANKAVKLGSAGGTPYLELVIYDSATYTRGNTIAGVGFVLVFASICALFASQFKLVALSLAGIIGAILGTCITVFQIRASYRQKASLRVLTDEMQIWEHGKMVWAGSWLEPTTISATSSKQLRIEVQTYEGKGRVWEIHSGAIATLKSAIRVLSPSQLNLALKRPARRMWLRGLIAMTCAGISAFAIWSFFQNPLGPWSILMVLVSVFLPIYPLAFVFMAVNQIGFLDRQRGAILARAGHSADDILNVLPIMDFERLNYRYAHPEAMVAGLRSISCFMWFVRAMAVPAIGAIWMKDGWTLLVLYLIWLLFSEACFYNLRAILRHRNLRLEVSDRRLFLSTEEEKVEIQMVKPKVYEMDAAVLSDGKRRWPIRTHLLIETESLEEAALQYNEAEKMLGLMGQADSK